MNTFRKFNAVWVPCNVRLIGDWIAPPYPMLRSDKGDIPMYSVSPYHGRSFVVAKFDNRYIVSKGNGLSYTNGSYINTGEMGDDTWGLLLKADARRDFILGNEIAKCGIKTNRMEFVLELGGAVELSETKSHSPILLQYSVECPYRLCDAAFMPKNVIENETSKWKLQCEKSYDYKHLMAAEVLIRNLKTLHDKGILYNAFHIQNYTWALELVDFELACSPEHPYSDEDSLRHVKDLFPREIIQTYEIINYIAWVLKEPIDYRVIDAMFHSYGFDINYCKLILE